MDPCSETRVTRFLLRSLESAALWMAIRVLPDQPSRFADKAGRRIDSSVPQGCRHVSLRRSLSTHGVAESLRDNVNSRNVAH